MNGETVAMPSHLVGTIFPLGIYVAGILGVLAVVMMGLFSDAPLINILGNKA